MKNEILICDCGDISHQLVFSYDEEENEVLLEYHLLHQKGFFQRLKTAFAYLFNSKYKQGAFHSIILTKDNYYKLEEVCDFFNGKE